MNLSLIAILGILGGGLYNGYKFSKTIKKEVDSTFFDKLLAPLNGYFYNYYSNSGLMVNEVLEQSLMINTPEKELYGFKVEGGSNVPFYLGENSIERVYRSYKDKSNAFFFYVILKQGFYQRQYIFSYNKSLISELADDMKAKLMSGKELINVILDLYLQNNFYIKDKKIQHTLSLNMKNELESSYLTFNKIAKENIYSNLLKTDLFQNYKIIENVDKTDITKLLSLDFDGSFWFYFNFETKTIERHLAKIINISKWHGKKEVFKALKDNYDSDSVKLFLVNSTAHLKRYDEAMISTIGNCLKCDFLHKDIYRKNTLQRTPLKYRDSEFDFLVDDKFMNNFVCSVHKKSPNRPDFWGFDKNNSFVSYSFDDENSNPHCAIIAKSGSGKSFQKLEILSQLIDFDFDTYECKNLGNHGFKIRDYDIGFTNEVFCNAIASNKANSINIISSYLHDFAYNILNIDMTNNQTMTEDIEFAIALINIILEVTGSKILTTGEEAAFKQDFKKMINDKSYSNKSISDIFNKKIVDEILALGYDEDDNILDIKETKYHKFNQPILNDLIVNIDNISKSAQLRKEEREDYESLSKKLKDVSALEQFNRIGKDSDTNADYINMDLNNFKENKLFVPYFLCIFQKIYLKDREFALTCKRNRQRKPKLFYAMEEAHNFFAVPYFTKFFDKIAREGRKYGVHFCLITQNAGDIPKNLLANLDTKIFLINPGKRDEAIDEITKNFTFKGENTETKKQFIEQIKKTDKYEMLIQYSGGIFNMKFKVDERHIELFKTSDLEEEQSKSGA